MQIYNYDVSGVFTCASEADESPLEPGVFLIPAYASTIAPPALTEGEKAVFENGSWVVNKIPDVASYNPTEPVQTEEDILVEQKSKALAALDKSDKTILRCYENSMPVPAEWAAYRKALRAIISDTSGDINAGLPEQPDYPAGT